MSALSIDTAANVCAVAITDIKSGVTLASQSQDISRGHAEILMQMIDACLKQSQTAISQVNRVVCTSGPGSFTGVRVGLSAARAIALGLTKPVIGVSNLQACAYHASKLSNCKMPVLAVIDARRGQLYAQIFKQHAPLSEPRICRIDQLHEELGLSEYDEIAYCGSGASRYLEHRAISADCNPVIIHEDATSPIEIIAELGIDAPEPDLRPVPIYLRQADAKKQHGFAVERVEQANQSKPAFQNSNVAP